MVNMKLRLNKDHVITMVLLAIMLLNAFDVVTDIHLGVPLWHILEEAMIVVFSGLTALYLIYDIRLRTKQMGQLGHALRSSEKKLVQLSEEMRQARHQYSVSISQQLQLWGLTSSEKEVALLMLKGLNFQEVAAVRNTKEKTVRQQASAIYAKSGLDGRHEFAAWFLEDFLSEAA